MTAPQGLYRTSFSALGTPRYASKPKEIRTLEWMVFMTSNYERWTIRTRRPWLRIEWWSISLK